MFALQVAGSVQFASSLENHFFNFIHFRSSNGRPQYIRKLKLYTVPGALTLRFSLNVTIFEKLLKIDC